MNSFSHALPFLDLHPYYPLGCALPDWLGAVDRRCRVRKNGAAVFLDDEDPIIRNIAGGITQHIDDDRWFHAGPKFAELSLQFAVELREQLVNEPGFRPGFLGHIIIELLLDAYLHIHNPGKLDKFYEIVLESDPHLIEQAVNRMSTRPTQKLEPYFKIFDREKYLYDYVDNDRLMYRINHVLRRVKLKPVDDAVNRWVESARTRVYESAKELLFGNSIASVVDNQSGSNATGG